MADDGESGEADTAERAMTLLWLGFTVAYVVFFYVFQDASEIADSSLDGYLEVVLLGIPCIVLLTGAMWLREATVDRDLRSRVVGWTVATAVLFLVAMWTALFVIETRFDPGEQWLILLLSLGFGASAGTAMGVVETKSKQRERERNRSIVMARRRERERSQLEYLNQYLRHEVLNEVNKINGYADLLAVRGDLEGEAAGYLEVVRDSGAEIAAFVESIRTILDASDHDPDLSPVDVVGVVEAEATAVERLFPGVSVAVDAPASATVLAGDLLDRVFRNLMENAIEHNGDDVTIRVGVEADGDRVTVRVRDDGAGIPTTDRGRLFDPPESGDHGYGLFLTHNLVEVYGGRLDLGETGPEGTEFVVEFDAAEAAAGPATGARRGRRRPA